MNNRLILTLVGVAVLGLSAPGLAQPPASPKPAKVLRYLAAADIDPARLIPAPPADGSDANKAELAELHDLARMVEELIYHRQLAMAAQQLHDQLQQNASRDQLAASAGQVEFLLTHDTLTGLANRQALLGAIRERVADWGRRTTSAAEKRTTSIPLMPSSLPTPSLRPEVTPFGRSV